MGDTRRGVQNIVRISSGATSKLIEKIQARDDVPPRARDLMDNMDRKLKLGADKAERALDREGKKKKKKTSHGHSHKHSSRPSSSSKQPSSKSPKGYPQPPKVSGRPPKVSSKPPPGYPSAKPNKPIKYSASGSGLTLQEKITQKVMDPKVRAKIEKGEMFIRKQVAKKLRRNAHS